MLTGLQARAARLMARNRRDGDLFAGAAVIEELREPGPAGLDGERTVDALCRQDVQALEDDGLDVLLDVDLWSCAEASVRDELGRQAVIRWRPETRMRYFPLVKDPAWGVRLHRSDIAVNRILSAATRREARDVADLALIQDRYCPLGPLFLAASVKTRARSPLALVDMARHRAAITAADLAATSGGPPEWNSRHIMATVFDGLDAAHDFLRIAEGPMLGGLPVDECGTPVDRVEDMASLRPVLDGGGRFPDFPGCPPEFGGAGSLGNGP